MTFNKEISSFLTEVGAGVLIQLEHRSFDPC